MSDFSDLLATGFRAILAVTDRQTLTAANGVTKPVLATPLAISKEMRDTGYWPKFACTAEILRIDADALQLVDRSLVTYRDEARNLSYQMRVIGLDPDPADPCVRLTLKEDPHPGR